MQEMQLQAQLEAQEEAERFREEMRERLDEIEERRGYDEDERIGGRIGRRRADG